MSANRLARGINILRQVGYAADVSVRIKRTRLVYYVKLRGCRGLCSVPVLDEICQELKLADANSQREILFVIIVATDVLMIKGVLYFSQKRLCCNIKSLLFSSSHLFK